MPLISLIRARWAVAAIFFANGTIIGAWAAQIPVIETRHAISHTTLGTALLMMALGALVAMPLTGMVITRVGSAVVTRFATGAFLLSFPLPLIAPDPAFLFAGLFVFGAGNGAIDVAMNAHGVMVEGRLKRPVMSSYHGMWSLGGLLGAGAAAAMFPLIPPNAAATVTLIVVGVVAVVALFFLLPSEIDGSVGASAFALPSRDTIGLGTLCFLCMFGEGAVLDWSALHLKANHNLSAGLAATGFAVYSASMAGSRFVGDWLRANIGAVVLVRASALLAALGMVISLAVPVPWLAVLGFALVGLGLANLVPVFFGAAGRIPGEASGTAIAAVATLGYTGFLLGPPLIGFIADWTSLRLALGLIVLSALVIALFANAVAPAERAAAHAA